MARLVLATALSSVLVASVAPIAEAQLQDGDILVDLFGCGSGPDLLQGYRVDGTLVYQTSGGTGTCWEGCSLLPDGRIATSRRSPAHGIVLFGPSGAQSATFDTPLVSPFPADVDGFSDGTIVVCNQSTAALAYDGQGNHVLTFTAPGLVRSFGCHVDFNDELWIADIWSVGSNNGGVYHFDRQGNFLGGFQTAFEASDLVVALDGTLWVADRNNGIAYHMLADGTVLSSFPAVAQGLRMSGITLLPDGTLVFTAEKETRLLRYDTQGNLLNTINLPTGSSPLFLDTVGDPAWSNLGNALPGAAGAPSLTGQGDLMPGSGTFLTLGSAAPNASSALIIGVQEANLPFFGGTLVPSPDIVIFGIPTGATGGWILAGTWPAGVPAGTKLHFQAWINDAQAPQGYSASNGLRATAP